MKINISMPARLSFLGAALLLLFVQQTTSSYSHKMADTIWQQLGLSQAQGTEKIRYSFATGYSNMYGIRNAKNIAAGNRAAVARNLFQYTKTYVSGAEFRNYYTKERASYKPVAPEAAKTKEEIRREMIAEMEKSIRDAEKAMAGMTADIKKAIQPSVDDARKQLEEYRKPDSKMVEIRYQGEQMKHRSETERYERDLKKWEADYPAGINDLVRSRLEKYLSIAQTVDFDAELVEKYGKKRFVNPAYESKSSDWKMIYRAGREVYEAVRPLVEEWLKQL